MTTYRQLDNAALDVLNQACERFGSITKVAEKIGYKRASVSLARALKYPGDTAKMRSAILANLTELIECPYLKKNLTAVDCERYRNRAVPTSSRSEVKFWQACQTCQFNPHSTLTRGKLNDEYSHSAC